MKMTWSRARMLASTALMGAAIGVAAAPSAFAADADAASKSNANAVDEVVVTGSHIPTVGFDTLQPAESLGADVLEQRGFTNAGDALNELPIFGAAGSNNTGQQSGSVVGEQFVNLYGLGAQRTLVLVDGRRFVSGNAPTVPGGAFTGAPAGQEVDLNDIPTGLIDHIEVIGIGGAPTYGADAIAGTVNIILKKNYQGVTMEGQYGTSYKGDGKDYVGRFLAGTNFADDKGNITLSVEYTQQDGLTYADRPRTMPYETQEAITGGCGNDPISGKAYLACLVSPATVPSINPGGIPTIGGAAAAALYPTLKFGAFDVANNPSATNPNSFPLAIKNAAGQIVAFAPDGTLQPYNLGNTEGSLVFGQGGDGLNLANESSFIAPNKRVLIDSLMHYDFTDHLTGYLETEFSHVDGKQLAAQNGYASALFDGTPSGTLTFTTANPFLNPQAAAILNANGASTFILSRANLDLIPSSAENSLDTYRVVAGFKGDFGVLGRKVNFDASFNYGESQGTETNFDLNFQNFENAINAVVSPTTGQIVCASSLTTPTPLAGGQQPNSPATCAPLDLFGRGAPSQAALAYVTVKEIASSILTERDAQINFNGSPFDLWAGPVKLAAGFEYRQEGGQFTNDGFAVAGLGYNLPATNVSGSYESKEYYLEGVIPVISPSMHIPFVNSLEGDASYRHIDNSLAGPEDVYTLGGKLRPIEELELRGNFTHSVRAPSISELFLPISSVSLFANDPCDPRYIATNANYQKNCQAVFGKLGVNLSTFSSNIVNASVSGTEGGNPNLKDESANSWTVGAVWRPHFVPRLQIAVDWINIQLSDAIESLSPTQVLDACYSADSFPNAYCNLFTRNAAGQITSYQVGEQNIAGEEETGLQMQSSYNVDVSDIPYISKLGLNTSRNFGNLAFNLNAYFENSHSTTILGLITPTRGNVGDPVWKVNGSVRYRIGPVSVYLNGRYISPGKANVLDSTYTNQISEAGNYWVWNSAVSYDVTKHITATLTVNNLFAQDPPSHALLIGGQNAIATYDYFGQAFVFALKARF